MSLISPSILNETGSGTSPALLGFGTATPPALTQDQILQLALGVSGGTPAQQAWLTRLFRGSGIQLRGTILGDSAPEFYPPCQSATDAGPTTQARMLRYAAEAPVLAGAAVQRALSESQIQPAEITHLFTASCTGFMAPGLDCSLIEQLRLSPQVRRLHIGFMGCHAAFNLLAAASNVIRADPTAKVLACCVELCSLHLAYGWDPGKLVANALFADGAAAVIMGTALDADAPLPHLVDTSSMLLPDSRDAMTWRIGNHGFEMTLSPGLPNLVRKNLRPWCEAWLARHDLKIRDIASWAIHPGGPKILDAIAEALELSNDDQATSRCILARHGNMSSATILFILRELFAQNPVGPCVAIGLGPGLMIEGMLLNSPPQ